MKAVLLCGGIGSRFLPHTTSYSKMALPFLNLPIVSYPLKQLHDMNISGLLVNTHHQPEQVKQTLSFCNANRIKDIRFTFEPQLLGGLGILFANRDFLDQDHFIYLNGDSVFLSNEFMESLIRVHKSKRALITFLVSPSRPKDKSSIWTSGSSGQVQYVSSDQKNHPNSSADRPYFFPGLACISPEIFEYLKPNHSHLFKDLVPKIKERCWIYPSEDLKFFEVGSLETYLNSTEECLDILDSATSIYQTQLLQIFKHYASNNKLQKNKEGLILHEEFIEDISSLKVRGFAVIGKDVIINQDIEIERGILTSRSCPSKNIKRELLLPDA